MQYSPDFVVVSAAQLPNDLIHLFVSPGADEDLRHSGGGRRG